MSAAAGLLPEVTTIVSNAVSLHPRIPGISNAKIKTFTPAVGRFTTYISPRWGLDAPDLLAKAVVAVVRLTHHECDNIVCRMVSFTYGVGYPCLWAHENLSDGTHDWISGEFADVSINFFRQMAESVQRGHMVSVGDLPQLPRSFASGPPQTDARFVLFAGRDNKCFLPASQEATFEVPRRSPQRIPRAARGAQVRPPRHVPRRARPTSTSSPRYSRSCAHELPKRQNQQAGRFARVDGIPFAMPVNSEDSPALMAGFTCDGDAAQALLPGNELHAVRLPNGRGMLIVTVIDYRTTDIGRYVEYSIALACTMGAKRRGLISSVVRMKHAGTGQYVWDLPVSSLISVKGGKGIWGMPKHQANLDFRVDEHSMSSQYDLDGKLCMRITVDRPHGPTIPLRKVGAGQLVRVPRPAHEVVDLLQ
jgi:hypothetical protein